MNPKQFEQICLGLGRCVRHADARSTDLRTTLVPSPHQPLVIMELWPVPTLCAHCDRWQSDRIRQVHWVTPHGWRSRCTTCKLDKMPGRAGFGPGAAKLKAKKPDAKPKPSRPAKPQLLPTVPVPNVAFVEQVVVRESHESVIREFVKIPIDSLPDSNDGPDSDNAVHKD